LPRSRAGSWGCSGFTTTIKTGFTQIEVNGAPLQKLYQIGQQIQGPVSSIPGVIESICSRSACHR
jgi:hypothetical protein